MLSLNGRLSISVTGTESVHNAVVAKAGTSKSNAWKRFQLPKLGVASAIAEVMIDGTDYTETQERFNERLHRIITPVAMVNPAVQEDLADQQQLDRLAKQSIGLVTVLGMEAITIESFEEHFLGERFIPEYRKILENRIKPKWHCTKLSKDADEAALKDLGPGACRLMFQMMNYCAEMRRPERISDDAWNKVSRWVALNAYLKGDLEDVIELGFEVTPEFIAEATKNLVAV